ncbi:MAG: hypothetical protein HQ494_05580 [Rhodospirillales bacterium]|nr:hypothetical protein [Rhodospirillales bacterium]
MAKMRYGLVLIGLIAFAAPAPAAEPPPPPSQNAPAELLQEGTRQILRAFELFLSTIPQYEAPEVLKNGDIIIRRKHPGQTPADPKKAPADDLPDKTKT